MQQKKFVFKKSMELFSKALDLMPGGVSSNARLWKTARFCPIYTPCSIFAKKAHGPHIWDVDGNKYIDYRLGFGPVILGHSNPAVRKALSEQLKKGSIYALDNELELDVAEKLTKTIPCAERVRFSVTGGEATMHAIRVARAYTKKDVILKFEGHFHGNHDYLLFSTSPPYDAREKVFPMTPGIPNAIRNLVMVEEWNDFDGIEKTVKEHHDKIAAIITEPIMGNAAAIMPKQGYLEHLRELCDKYNIVLIFDEVKTGFRAARGGAQELFGVTPHLATFAKSMANGYPISAIVGQREIMELYGPPTTVAHGGTYASNPVSLTAAKATLQVLEKKKTYKKLNAYGNELMKGIKKTFEHRKQHAIVQGIPTMFQFLITKQHEIYKYCDLAKTDADYYSRIHYEMLTYGVMLEEDNQEPMFTSLAHSKHDLKHTLAALSTAIENAKTLKSPMTKAVRFKHPPKH